MNGSFHTVVMCVVSHFSCQLLTMNVFNKAFGWLAWFVVMEMTTFEQNCLLLILAATHWDDWKGVVSKCNLSDNQPCCLLMSG